MGIVPVLAIIIGEADNNMGCQTEIRQHQLVSGVHLSLACRLRRRPNTQNTQCRAGQRPLPRHMSARMVD